MSGKCLIFQDTEIQGNDVWEFWTWNLDYLPTSAVNNRVPIGNKFILLMLRCLLNHFITTINWKVSIILRLWYLHIVFFSFILFLWHSQCVNKHNSITTLLKLRVSEHNNEGSRYHCSMLLLDDLALFFFGTTRVENPYHKYIYIYIHIYIMNISTK